MPGDAPGAGFDDLGDFGHPDEEDVLGFSENHVLWHHVRDALYQEGELNMQIVSILSVKVEGLSVSPATAELEPLDTQQLTLTFDPVTATNRNVIYSTSDEEIATVSASGLITAVADGETTITATASDGGWSDTCVVTVATL